MRARQWKTFESLLRVRESLTHMAPRGDATFGNALGALDAAIDTLHRLAATQHSAPASTRAEAARQKDLIDRLLRDHMAPIVAITRSLTGPGRDAALATMFRMPRGRVTVLRALVLSDVMMLTAQPFSDLLVAEGMPPDWLTRFAATREELERTRPRRANASRAKTEATAGIDAALRRGRLAVARLDALMRAAYRRDDSILIAWRRTKRVHLLPKRGGSADEGTASVGPD